MQSMYVLTTATGEAPPTWGWDFLVGSSGDRLWLGRFLVAVRPRWSMRDQFHSESSDSAGEGDWGPRMSGSFVGAVPPGGGCGRGLMGVVSARGFSVLVGPVGTLIVASFLVSWGWEVAFLSSLLSLGYFLGLSVCCSLWDCMAFAVSWGLMSSEPRGWIWCFGVCFLFLWCDDSLRYIMISFEHYFVHGWEMALHSL